MKNMNFKKVLSVIGGVALLGISGTAGVMAYPNAFTNSDGIALVYGSNASQSDINALNLVNTNVISVIDSLRNNQSVLDSEYLTENEVVLGTRLIDNGRFKTNITDNKISTLIDGKIHWDNGVDSKTNYNVHEEILLGDMKIITTFDNKDLNETALTNDKDLEYRYVFDEDLKISLIGDEDADTLEIKVLGNTYEVDSFDGSSMSISTSTQKVVRKGDTLTYDGKSVVVEEIFDDAVQIGGVLINEGKTKKVNGLEVYVDTAVVHSYDATSSVAIVKVGSDIEKIYNDGDAYIGEDEDDPTWVWSIKNPGEKGGYIGVRYDHREIDEEDNLVYEEKSYNFPNKFSSVTFDGLTDVTYGKYNLFFNSEDLYTAVDGNTPMYTSSVPVLVLEGKEDDSFIVNGNETNKVYLYYQVGDSTTSINSSIEVFFNDVNKDYSTSAKPRFTMSIPLNGTANRANGHGEIGQLTYEDTEMPIEFNFTKDLSISESNRTISIGDLKIKLNDNGSFSYFGKNPEDAESDELQVNGNISVGSREDDLMDYYGLKIQNPESTLENDEISLEIPSEKVYAKISVTNSAKSEVKQLGTLIVKDTEIDSVKDKDLIVVGGSCINKAAAKILGLAEGTCGADFTAATGIGNGQSLIKEYVSPYNSSKVAYVIAGYEAIDTTNAVNSIVS
jgi:hypothetical protein